MSAPKAKRAKEAVAKSAFFAEAASETVYKGHGIVMQDGLEYMAGFGGERCTEAKPGALPMGQNTPQRAPLGLFAEQLSGTAFTRPRDHNQRTWFYRIHPSAGHAPFERVSHPGITGNFSDCEPNPNQFRWQPFKLPDDKTSVTFVDGLHTVAGCGDTASRNGVAYYTYTCNASMDNAAFQSADGDLLIVPQQGTLHVTTEHGLMKVHANEICVIQRGIRFSVAVDGPTRGYICEIFDGHFEIPSLGPIGANGLANPRDFLTPVAAFDDTESVQFTIYNKYQGALFKTTQDHTPFDVVAWHGNYAPYKYDLSKFCVINSVSFDHIDPSIFTVLTCPSAVHGRALVDFVIFPPRWSVHEHTFRPPYFHRNCMSEFMGLIKGHYEAKAKGFLPGGATLHSIMTPHGPDRQCVDGALSAELKPELIARGTQAFMFESYLGVKATKWALEDSGVLEKDYVHVWDNMPRLYKA